jgi:LPS-assembly lipoprotein
MAVKVITLNRRPPRLHHKPLEITVAIPNKMSMRAVQTFILATALSLSLSACQLRPVYAGGTAGQSAQFLGAVDVPAIEGKAGWLVRDALSKRLRSVSSGQERRYQIKIELDDQITGFGVRRDDTVTRERRSLRARYQLIDTQNGATLLDATAGSDAGIDVVSSEYATVAAENSALERLSEIVADQIIARVAQYAQNGK